MRVNIIYHDNGVGLSRDAQLCKSLIEECGHTVKMVDVYGNQRRGSADINLYLELFHIPSILDLAPVNYVMPNPEWFPRNWLPDVMRRDRGIKVLCKTRDTQQIFSQYAATVYTGFTSSDRLLKDVAKDKVFLHSAGKSEYKNTKSVHDCWILEQVKHRLILCKYNNTEYYKDFSGSNVYRFLQRMDDTDLKVLQNRCLFHVCPSQYEGFGHYINEARSTGAILITTDAAPMREFIDGNGLLVKTTSSIPAGVARLWNIDKKSLKNVVDQVMSFDDAELAKMSARSRELYERDDKFFREKFKALFTV